jgi:uncharacterized OsmC-like protein
MLIKNFNSLYLKRNFFNQTKRSFAVKTFKIESRLDSARTISKLANGTEIEIQSPMEHLIASAGTCEIHTIAFFAKQSNIKIEDIKVNLKGEYDLDFFLGKKEGNNTLSSLDVEINIKSSELDRKKLQETVEVAVKRCPLMSTIDLAGVKINKKINYL